jgi:chemotaxis signal transduction protein
MLDEEQIVPPVAPELTATEQSLALGRGSLAGSLGLPLANDQSLPRAESRRPTANGYLAEPDSPPGTERELPRERKYCVFRTGRRLYCLEMLDVQEIVVWPAITPLPLTPVFLTGIFNLRGKIVPVIDISIAEEPGLSAAQGRRPELGSRQVIVARWTGEIARAEAGSLTSAATVPLGLVADEIMGTYTAAEALLTDALPEDVTYSHGRLPYVQETQASTNALPPDRLPLVLDVRRLAEAFPVPAI